MKWLNEKLFWLLVNCTSYGLCLPHMDFLSPVRIINGCEAQYLSDKTLRITHRNLVVGYEIFSHTLIPAVIILKTDLPLSAK